MDELFARGISNLWSEVGLRAQRKDFDSDVLRAGSLEHLSNRSTKENRSWTTETWSFRHSR